MLKFFFYIVNVIFIILYIYPGSIFGLVFYNNLDKQPNLTRDFSFNFIQLSSNHIYSFLLISIFGFLIFWNKNRNSILIYLFSISIILEIFHFYIPKRSFEFSDLGGNFFGIIIAFILFKTFLYVKKIFF